MQDKEFDQIFKDQFEGAEMMPSAAVWKDICKDLKPERKRGSAFYWMVAASVVVAFGLAVLFTSKEKVKLQGKAELAEISHSAVPARSLPIVTKATLKVPDVGVRSHTQSAVRAVKSRTVAGNNLRAMQPNDSEQHLTDVKASLRNTESILTQQNKLIEVELPLLVLTTKADSVDEEVGTMPRNADDFLQDAGQNASNGRARIRNAGDLVNFVVDKLDKREQKIVAFNTDDDDNSSLVALNIGPFRFNSKKHK